VHNACCGVLQRTAAPCNQCTSLKQIVIMLSPLAQAPTSVSLPHSWPQHARVAVLAVVAAASPTSCSFKKRRNTSMREGRGSGPCISQGETDPSPANAHMMWA
jgi:hypothetical protein